MTIHGHTLMIVISADEFEDSVVGDSHRRAALQMEEMAFNSDDELKLHIARAVEIDNYEIYSLTEFCHRLNIQDEDENLMENSYVIPCFIMWRPD